MHAHALPRESWLPVKVAKRDGTQVEFNAAKIENAILKAGEASGEFSRDEAVLLTAQVIKVLSHTGYRGQNPGIERIQDIVEQVLISANHLKTARAYIVYREQHKKLREDRRTLLDVSASVSEYLQRTDWRVSANANQG
ncbi:MAG: ATP cone domain-containing protein, partial [Candidatus Thiodiazotropha sp.]